VARRTREIGLRMALGAPRAQVVWMVMRETLVLVAAGLFAKTLSNLHSIDLGFNREHVLLFRLDARKAGHKDPEIAAFYGDLRKQFSAIPGVRNASLSEDSLIEAGTGLPLGVAGAAPNDANRILNVGPAFFATMQIPMLEGRDIQERDGPGAPAVAVINEEFVKTSFGGRNPLGRHLIMQGEGDRIARDMEIVGVSRNARYGGLKEAIPPVAYMPYDQGFPRPDRMVYELRTAGDPLGYVNSVREIVRRADARVPVYEIRTQEADIDRTINQEITFAALCSGFALLALAIASVGLYGTVSYNVARRTGEIGIRMALGAEPGRVVGMVLGEVVGLAAAGLAVGMAAALATSKFVASFLYGIKANDPLAPALAVVILLAAAMLAGYAPARKASRIDPMTALRHE